MRREKCPLAGEDFSTGWTSSILNFSEYRRAKRSPWIRSSGFLLEVAWEALENAGQGPRDLAARRTGVFVGLTSDEYAQLSIAAAICRDSTRTSRRGSHGAWRAAGSPTCSALQGPNMSIDTACSSSLVAVHTACHAPADEECRMALAGGVERGSFAGNRDCVFEGAHDGAGRAVQNIRCAGGRIRARRGLRHGGAEAARRMRSADGDHILAVIRGSAVNQDGRSSGMTAPNGMAQEAVIRAALAQAGVRAGGDRLRGSAWHGHRRWAIRSKRMRWRRCSGRGATQENPLVVGSVKTNIGHLEAAAGIAGLIKVVLSLQHEQIPAHLHFQQMNPHIDWGGVPVEIPVQGRPWPRERAAARGGGEFVRLQRHQRARDRGGGASAAGRPQLRASGRCIFWLCRRGPNRRCGNWAGVMPRCWSRRRSRWAISASPPMPGGPISSTVWR